MGKTDEDVCVCVCVSVLVQSDGCQAVGWPDAPLLTCGVFIAANSFVWALCRRS